ncbi:hypothetical protein SAMN05428963_101247 [Consotaella salsifontis]|uniref:Transposase of IS4/5 family n=1 Tax=Consotaella salsifontis TaxID=1365950 RepID=A0A1T4LK31_9HYPH|nr:hypothetical protein SAMN05428963_101247 [Consotaella salsifontis]
MGSAQWRSLTQSPGSEIVLRRHELPDEEWAVIELLLPRESRGVARVDNCRSINGILRRSRTDSSRSATGLGPALQTLHALAERRRVGPPSGSCLRDSQRRHRHDRQLLRSRPSALCRRAKKGICRSLHGPFPQRRDYQNPCPRRCPRTPSARRIGGWAGWRHPMATKLFDAVTPGATVIADEANDPRAPAPSSSVDGSSASATSSSASSSASSRCDALLRATTAAPTTSPPLSSLLPTASR